MVNPNHPKILKIGETITFYDTNSNNIFFELTLISNKEIKVTCSLKSDTLTYTNSDGEIYEDLDTIWINTWYFES